MAQPKYPTAYLKKHSTAVYSKADMKKREESEVVLNDDRIEPSSFLPEEHHERFRWFVDEFAEMGILNNVDGDALSRYIMADFNYWKVNDELEQMNVAEEGYSRLSNVQNRFFNQAIALSKELGLTMAARGKLKREKEDETEKEQSPEEKLFGNALGLN